jgi:hypothetical protein
MVTPSVCGPSLRSSAGNAFEAVRPDEAHIFDIGLAHEPGGADLNSQVFSRLKNRE